MLFKHRGLYAITPEYTASPEALVAGVALALRGGAGAVQYRDKSHDETRRHREAGLLRALCQDYGVPLIINDDVALARRVGAGVHLGKDDASLVDARALLGPQAIIGVSCYADLERAVHAQAAGATYVAFGRFFPSSSKPLAAPAPLRLLSEAREQLQTPIVAIGGIDLDHAPSLLAAGAGWLAVIHGLFGFGQAAIEARARALTQLIVHEDEDS